MVLRVGYVREHFSSPLLQFADADQGDTFVLHECPGGTGQLTAALASNEIDVAIALTDALIAGIARGSKAYKLVGSYVSSSLNWAVVTGKDAPYQSIADLKETVIGISRLGSGSQTMAYVMALQQGWFAGSNAVEESLKFKVNQDLQGLIKSVNDGSTSAFLWEWFTTKPHADAGEVRFIGSVLTPWPSWMIAAQPQTPSVPLREFMGKLITHIQDFDSFKNREANDVEYIKDKFGYKEEDIRAWLKTVRYPADCTAIEGKVIVDTLTLLERSGVVQRPPEGFNPVHFINPEVVRLTPSSPLI